jgi:hypothetical protein
MNLEEATAYVLEVGHLYFEYLNQDNFIELFKLTPRQVAIYLLTTAEFGLFQMEVRNFLLFLFWCRHYLPYRVLAVLFHMGKSTVHRIIHAQLNALRGKLPDFVNVNDMAPLQDYPLVGTVGIVDATEVYIERKDSRSFYSGKKKRYTVKYQVVTDIDSGIPIHVAGPYAGSVHDANMWQQSMFGEYLELRGLFVLGDKGYQGCRNVYFMRKRQRGQAELPARDKAYNVTISEKRVEIEQYFGLIKDWKVINHVFRGDLLSHCAIFSCCLILTHFSKL